MFRIEESIDVALPVSVVYHQWTQFEEFPDFMEGVEKVERLDGRRLRWHASIGGVEHQWDARISEQIPNERIAWETEAGTSDAGSVTFHSLTDFTTRVVLELDFEQEATIEKAADMVGMVRRRAAGDLERFREFIESRRRENGFWRREISRNPSCRHVPQAQGEQVNLEGL